MIHSSRWLWRTAITGVGVGGFVGLLVTSHYFPSEADPLRVLAMIWFFGFGAARFALDIKAGADAEPRTTDAVRDGRDALLNGSGGQTSASGAGSHGKWGGQSSGHGAH
jgi:hypothetical protein